ncbi:hypothetical protein LXL04_003954 [Taraxacum kok-saghyz]
MIDGISSPLPDRLNLVGRMDHLAPPRRYHTFKKNMIINPPPSFRYREHTIRSNLPFPPISTIRKTNITQQKHKIL